MGTREGGSDADGDVGLAGPDLDAAALRAWAGAAVDELIAHTDEINGLNVFPVADADTGTNMLYTMRAAATRAQRPDVADTVAAVGEALAAGALRGARGNSGVILSQILRGLADAVNDAPNDGVGDGAVIDGATFAGGLERGLALVTASLGRIVPGTVVSVLAAAAAAAARLAAEEPSGQTAAVVRAAANAAARALDLTPRQLDVLADAGVVDAGGRGLLVLLDTLTTTLGGHPPRRGEFAGPRSGGMHAGGHDIRPDTWHGPGHRAGHDPEQDTQHDSEHDGDGVVPRTAPRYEVMYLLAGVADADVPGLRDRLAELGDSVAVAASGAEFSVHVHADDAGAAIEAGLAIGVPSRIQVTGLSGPGRPSAGARRSRAVLAVVDGDGAADLFAGEGALVLRRPPGAPVSARQLLRGVVDAGAGQIMMLPNGYVAAEELVAGCAAAIGWGVDVVPLPVGSMVQGLAALAVHDAGRRAVDDGYEMARAAAAARHGSVRIATEEALTWAGTCTPGDGLGISGDEVLIVARDVAAAGTGLIDLLLSSGGELVTVLVGAGVDPAVADALAEHVRRAHLGAELVTYETGHGGDALLIGVE